MQANYTIVGLVLAYMAAIGLISFYAKRFSTSAHSFTSGTTGGKGFPAILIGFLLMSGNYPGGRKRRSAVVRP